jgi:hypothetical protein
MAIVEEAVVAVVVVVLVDLVEAVLSTGTAKLVKLTLKRRFINLGVVKMVTPNSRLRKLLPLMLRRRSPITGVPPPQTTGVPPLPAIGVLLVLPSTTGLLPSPTPIPGVIQIPLLLMAMPSQTKAVAAKNLRKRIIP